MLICILQYLFVFLSFLVQLKHLKTQLVCPFYFLIYFLYYLIYFKCPLRLIPLNIILFFYAIKLIIIFVVILNFAQFLVTLLIPRSFGKRTPISEQTIVPYLLVVLLILSRLNLLGLVMKQLFHLRHRWIISASRYSNQIFIIFIINFNYFCRNLFLIIIFLDYFRRTRIIFLRILSLDLSRNRLL